MHAVCGSEDIACETFRIIPVEVCVRNGKQTIHKETYELKVDFASVDGCFDLNIYKSINVKMDLACVSQRGYKCRNQSRCSR